MSETTEYGQPPFTCCELGRGRIEYFPPGGIKGATNIDMISEAFVKKLKDDGALGHLYELLGAEIDRYNRIESEIWEKNARIWFGGSLDLYEPPNGLKNIPLGEYKAEVLPMMQLFAPIAQYYDRQRVMCPKLQVQTTINFEKDLPPSEVLKIAAESEKMEEKVLNYLKELIPAEWELGELVGGATVSCAGSNDPNLKDVLSSTYKFEQDAFFTDYRGQEATFGAVTSDRIQNAYMLLVSLGNPASTYLNQDIYPTLKGLKAVQCQLNFPSGCAEVHSKLISHRNSNSGRPYVTILTQDRASRVGVEKLMEDYRWEDHWGSDNIFPPVILPTKKPT